MGSESLIQIVRQDYGTGLLGETAFAAGFTGLSSYDDSIVDAVLIKFNSQLVAADATLFAVDIVGSVGQISQDFFSGAVKGRSVHEGVGNAIVGQIKEQVKSYATHSLVECSARPAPRCSFY